MSRNFDALKSPLQGFLGYYSRFVPPARWITFTGVPSTLTNFPVLVKAVGWENIANGYDVHFQDSSGNELSFDLDWYDDSSKTGAWWVQIPTLSSGTAIKALYGDASITSNQSSPATVWAGYSFVFHHSDTSKQAKNSVNGTTCNFQSGNSDTAGFSATFDSTYTVTGRTLRPRIYCRGGLVVTFTNSTTPWTWSVWGGYPEEDVKGYAYVAGNIYTGFGLGGKFYIYQTETDLSGSVSGGSNLFRYYGMGYDGSGNRVFRCDNATGSLVKAPGYNNGNFCHPVLDTNQYYYWLTSYYDEARVYNGFRSADWLEYEYLNSRLHNSYTTYSEEV